MTDPDPGNPFGAEFEIANPEDLLNPDGDTSADDLLTEADPRQLFSIPDTATIRFLDEATRDASKAKANTGRSLRRRFVRPENAALLVAALPDPGEHTHAILRGDFVLGDLIPPLLDRYGPADLLIVATLGMSTAQADTLAAAVETGTARTLRLLLSHYFAHIDRAGTYAQVLDRMEAARRRSGIDRVQIAVARSHVKIISFATQDGRHHLTLETSANLRSCDCLEQLTAINCPELHSFHDSWSARVVAKYEVPPGTKVIPKDTRTT